MNHDIRVHARSSITGLEIDLRSSTMVSDVGVAPLSLFVSDIDVISFLSSLNESYASIVLDNHHRSEDHLNFSISERSCDGIGYLVVVVLILGPPLIRRSRGKSVGSSIPELQQVPKLANIRSIATEDIYPRTLEKETFSLITWISSAKVLLQKSKVTLLYLTASEKEKIMKIRKRLRHMSSHEIKNQIAIPFYNR